jgi:hypothetical protein
VGSAVDGAGVEDSTAHFVGSSVGSAVNGSFVVDLLVAGSNTGFSGRGLCSRWYRSRRLNSGRQLCRRWYRSRRLNSALCWLLSRLRSGWFLRCRLVCSCFQNTGVVGSAVARTGVVGSAVDGTGVEDSTAHFVGASVGSAVDVSSVVGSVAAGFKIQESSVQP